MNINELDEPLSIKEKDEMVTNYKYKLFMLQLLNT